MTALLQPFDEPRQQLYERLLRHKHSSPNQYWLGRIAASWLAGQSVLPDFMGLEPEQFRAMEDAFFPNQDLPARAPSGMSLDFSRMLEKEDLINLLNAYRRDESYENGWIVSLIVSACLGSDHLWQDLGLWNRGELSELLQYNFPQLAARNTKDMKWKKFLYKQLCEAEGLYLCRAPSCEVCSDYPKCFGPED